MRSTQSGFTLAELLIALALLGVIAAFTIPKILQSSSSQEATAKVKETVSTLEQAWYNLKTMGAVLPGADRKLYDNIAPTLNTLRQSNTEDVFTAGVLTNPEHPCAAAGVANGWIQFPNGVLVVGLSDGADIDSLPWNDATHNETFNYLLCMDTNGNANPNTAGTDVFFGNFNQHGGFEGVPTNENAKAFRWGAPAESIMAPASATPITGPGGEAWGTFGEATFAGAASKLLN